MTGAKVAAASHPTGTVRACFPVPTTRHAMGGVGAGFVVHGDRITAAGPSRAVDRSQQWSKATTQGDEVRMVVDRTRCVGMGICEGIDPERFQVQADGKSPALKGNLEDDEVLEVARGI
jgi:ferredoxin